MSGTGNQLQKIKAIMFDVGGTLLEGAMPWHEVYRQALVLARHELDAVPMVRAYEDALARLVVARKTPATAIMEPRRLLHELYAECLGISYALFQSAVDEVLYDFPAARQLVCVDRVAEVLAELKSRGYRLGVISNWSPDLASTLEKFGLKQYFSGIYASQIMGYSKPDPAAFLVPVDRMGLTPGVTAYVGDLYPIDIIGSREAGLTPLMVDPLKLGLHSDVPTIEHVSQLLQTFRGVSDSEETMARRPRA